MKNTKDCYGFYLKCDVLFLAVVFENFRNESINSFELDSVHYLSTPGCSWDAMLRFMGVSLKLIPDIEKYQFIERIIKGGISMICKGHSEANYEFLKLYNPSERSTHVRYLDADNLY